MTDNANRDVFVGSLPKYEGVSKDEERKALETTRQWLYDNFFEDGKLETVLHISTKKGVAYLRFKDAKSVDSLLQGKERRTMPIRWENDTTINVRLGRAGQNQSASASSQTAAPAAQTGETKMFGKRKASPKGAPAANSAPGKPDAEPENAPTSADKGSLKDRLVEEAEEAILSGTIATALWEGAKFLLKKFASRGAEKIGDAIHDHVFGESPRETFAKYVTAYLTLDERIALDALLSDDTLFNSTQVEKLYENTVDMFEKVDPKNSKEMVLDRAGIKAARELFKKALTKPTHELQVAALVGLYVPKNQLPIGKIGHAFGHIKHAADAIESAVASTNFVQTTAARRANAERASQRRRHRKW